VTCHDGGQECLTGGREQRQTDCDRNDGEYAEREGVATQPGRRRRAAIGILQQGVRDHEDREAAVPEHV
jgi:hypothetical protein